MKNGAAENFAEERGWNSPRSGGYFGEARRELRGGTPAVIRALQEVREDRQRPYREKSKYKTAYL